MAYLSGAQLGAESLGGGRKNSARLSQRREKPRFRQTLRTVVKSGLKSDTKSRNSPFTGAQTILLKHTYRQVCHLPIQHVSSLVKQLYGHNVILCEPARLQEQKKRDL